MDWDSVRVAIAALVGSHKIRTCECMEWNDHV